jgi:hypothetical protein
MPFVSRQDHMGINLHNATYFNIVVDRNTNHLQQGDIMSTANKPEDLIREYTEMWSTTDKARRHDLVQKLWGENATLYINHPNVASFHGLADIEAHITFVNENEIQGHGLKFDSIYSTVSRNHDVIKFCWQTLDSTDKKVADGMDFMVYDVKDHIVSDYMFIKQID